MAHIKHSHKKVPDRLQISETVRSSIKFDTWRWVDLFLIVAGFSFLIAGRFTLIPFVFIIMTVIEVTIESAIRRSNVAWQNTDEGKNWVRRMTAACRLFFIPSKTMIFLIALFLLIARG